MCSSSYSQTQSVSITGLENEMFHMKRLENKTLSIQPGSVLLEVED